MQSGRVASYLEFRPLKLLDIVRYHRREGVHAPTFRPIVSHEYRFILFCVPKVASSSLRRALTKGDAPIAETPRISLRTLYDKQPRTRDYFTFGFARHPLTRLRSCWQERIQSIPDVGTPNLLGRTYTVRTYPGLRFQMSYLDFCRWVCGFWGQEVIANAHWRSQWPYLIPDPSARRPLDFVGTFENLDADFAKVMAAVNAPTLTLPRQRVSVGLDGKGAWDIPDKLLARVERRYAKDYALWEYLSSFQGAKAGGGEQGV